MPSYVAPKSPLCDPADFNLVQSRRGTIKEAWREYASRSTRPYTYETFRLNYKQWRASRQAEERNVLLEDSSRAEYSGAEFVASEQYWHSRTIPKASVLSLRNGASIRVQNGMLEISEQLPLHLAPDGRPQVVTFSGTEARRGRKLASPKMPKAIVLPEHGWFVTAEAVKFCLEHKIALISVSARSSQGERGLMTVVAGDAQANAALVRAQVTADPTAIAREVVRQKIATCVELGRLSAAQAQRHLAALTKARNVAQVMIVEAAAATVYWDARRCLVKSSSRRWPKDWQRFTARKSWVGEDGPRHADHPVNALLNWAYAVHAGRLATELLGRGAYLGIGFLHSDRPARYSLVYDALELLRPLIDERVFKFVGGAVFRMGDFVGTPSGPHKGEVRVSQELLKVFGPAVMLTQMEVEGAAEWMVEQFNTPRDSTAQRGKGFSVERRSERRLASTR